MRNTIITLVNYNHLILFVITAKKIQEKCISYIIKFANRRYNTIKYLFDIIKMII